MDVPLTNVIGTIALIGLVITSALAYSIVTSYIETNVLKQQLNQIAEYVALNLVEIVNLVNFANFLNNGTMMKILKLPSDLPYLVKLVNETHSGRGYYVQTQLVERSDITGSALIPSNATETGTIFVIDSSGTLNIVKGDAGSIRYCNTVYSGAQNIVVWGWKKADNTTWAGIGSYTHVGG